MKNKAKENLIILGEGKVIFEEKINADDSVDLYIFSLSREYSEIVRQIKKNLLLVPEKDIKKYSEEFTKKYIVATTIIRLLPTSNNALNEVLKASLAKVHEISSLKEKLNKTRNIT